MKPVSEKMATNAKIWAVCIHAKRAAAVNVPARFSSVLSQPRLPILVDLGETVGLKVERAPKHAVLRVTPH